MASSIPSILGRKLLPAAIAIAGGGGISPLTDGDKRSLSLTFGASGFGFGAAKKASCEAPPTPTPTSAANTTSASKSSTSSAVRGSNNPFLAPQLRETTLRKRMTSVGRFSLESETEDNRSIPTFFLALSGTKNEKSNRDDDNNKSKPSPSTSSPLTSASESAERTTMHKFSPRKMFTVSDFEDAWLRRDMPNRHPRFHSTVCPITQGHFEETHHMIEEEDDDESSLQIKAELDRHASETMHFSVYREDLRNRLEHMLVSPLEVSDKLWEVKISNGLLGSSGAISRAKVDAIVTQQKQHQQQQQQQQQQSHANENNKDDDKRVMLRRNTTRGGFWRDATQEVESIPMESILLFRSHHALADGASIMAALSDLCDEAEEIRADIERELNKWKRRGRGTKGPKKSALRRALSRMLRLMKMCTWFTLGTLRALLYQGYLQLTTRCNPFDAVREDAERKGLALVPGRSVSWCDAASLDEVKRVANAIGEARGVAITVNDLFVSCVTAAVARQLKEHGESTAPMDTRHGRELSTAVPNINVAVPVHLRGGVVLPGESVGNNIGAFVTRCPGEMKHDATGSERLHRVHESLLHLKRSPAPFVSHYLAKFCSDYLPKEWTKSIFRRANANACVVVSNNRSYAKKLHIDGMVVESAAGFLPLPPGIPIGVVVQSYAGTMSLSVTAEKYAVPDADKFLRWILDEYQQLREEASRLK